MALSWNEIRDRAIEFSNKWKDTERENADAKPFLVDFFNVFGISNRKVSTFEHPVKVGGQKVAGGQTLAKALSDNTNIECTDRNVYAPTTGYIDLFWKGTLLVEMKSKGKDLDKAFIQAKEYTQNLKEHELPKYILVSDFERFRLYDMEESETAAQTVTGGQALAKALPVHSSEESGAIKDRQELALSNVEVCLSSSFEYIEFTLHELVNNVQHFGFIAGYQKKVFKEQDPVNIKAAELMGKLHDRLKDVGYTEHPLEVYLVRILFCLFAEDTTIFNKQQFQDFIEQRTNIDGSDLAPKLQELFQVLNTPKDKRFKNIDEQLNEFPYVNGSLYEELLPTASFDSKMRQALLDCCYLDWSGISPAIFGAMFQSVMNQDERRHLGAHYTSEENILKVIKPLFMDELCKEFHGVKSNRNKLIEFHKKLSDMKFLDPACGCGNFLVISYRELRLLEIEILKVLNKDGQGFTDIRTVALLDVDQMYGIEIQEFPARIAEVALWLIDHQMNMKVSEEFGKYFLRLPLKKSPNIANANALRIDWNSLLKPRIQEIYFYDMGRKETAGKLAESKLEYSYIFGNPPFVGKQYQNQIQKEDMEKIFGKIKGAGVLDYVTAWYYQAAKQIKNTKIKVGFVSTNSISQGEQVGVLWNLLLNENQVKIHFAHRTFKWTNEARGKAQVYCVIIGFANYDSTEKLIYEYADINKKPLEIKAKNINPYLVDAKELIIQKRKTPICKVPKMIFGNMAIDGGNLFLNENEKEEFESKESNAKLYIKRVYGGDEFINNKKRWCLWLKDINPSELKKSKFVLERIELTRKFRLNSSRQITKKLADMPMLFGEIRQPNTDYIVLPKMNIERRKYMPTGLFSNNIIATDLLLIIPNSNLYHFGVVSSLMHNAWVKNVCGRLGNEIRYSIEIVYNNFPWPEKPIPKQIANVEKIAQKVLDVREEFLQTGGQTLAKALSVDTKEKSKEKIKLKDTGRNACATTNTVDQDGRPTLSDLYDPLSMPPKLLKAHADLDKAVDACYRSQPFTTESKRMEFLFELYEKYTAPLTTPPTKKKKAKSSTSIMIPSAY